MLNFKQTIVHLLNGVAQDELTFRASMNQLVNGKKQPIKSRTEFLSQVHKPDGNLEIHYGFSESLQEMTLNNESNRDAESVLVLFYLSVSSSS